MAVPTSLAPLRARRDRPRRCCCATEQRDELAPFPLTEMHPIPHGSGAPRKHIGLRRIGQRVRSGAAGKPGRVRRVWGSSWESWPCLWFCYCRSVTSPSRICWSASQAQAQIGVTEFSAPALKTQAGALPSPLRHSLPCALRGPSLGPYRDLPRKTVHGVIWDRLRFFADAW